MTMQITIIIMQIITIRARKRAALSPERHDQQGDPGHTAIGSPCIAIYHKALSLCITMYNHISFVDTIHNLAFSLPIATISRETQGMMWLLFSITCGRSLQLAEQSQIQPTSPQIYSVHSKTIQQVFSTLKYESSQVSADFLNIENTKSRLPQLFAGFQQVFSTLKYKSAVSSQALLSLAACSLNKNVFLIM